MVENGQNRVALSVKGILFFFLILISLFSDNSPLSSALSKETSVITEIIIESSEATEKVKPAPNETTETSTTGVATPAIQVTEPAPVHISVESLSLDRYAVSLTEGMSDMPIVTMLPADATDKSEVWWSDNTTVAIVDIYGNITGVGEGNCTVTVQSADNRSAFAVVAVTVSPKPNPQLTYIDGILIANKTYALPADYNPGVDPDADASLQEMFTAAAADGLNLFVCSGYRSYQTQADLYNYYVWRDGVAAADRYSARPGHSEHQSGLAFDINSTDFYFAGTPEANWIEANCHRFGFILRYPQGKEWATGYMYEPWHIRYIGKEKAATVYESGLCLEEYLGITSSY